jgi:high-affinity K+ transport system ATPase subunit B
MRERKKRKNVITQPSAFSLSIATDAASAFVFIPSMFIAEAIDDMVLMTW